MLNETSEPTTMRALADTLREAADLIDTLGAVGLTVPGHYISGNIHLHNLSREQLALFARTVGKARKSIGGAESFWLERDLGTGLRLIGFAKSRGEVCRKIVVGTEDVPEQTIPAHTRELVEWECEPILADALDPEAVA